MTGPPGVVEFHPCETIIGDLTRLTRFRRLPPLDTGIRSESNASSGEPGRGPRRRGQRLFLENPGLDGVSTMLDGGQHHDPTELVSLDQDENRRRLQALPLRAIAAFAARWGIRMEGLIYSNPQNQLSARRLIRVVVTVACGGLVTRRLDVTRAAFRFNLIAIQGIFLSAWHRVRMLWALARGDESRYSVSMMAHADAVALCNLAGAVARLSHAALAAEAFCDSADRIDDFDEALALNKAQLIGAVSFTAACTVAYFAGAEKAGVAAVSDLNRLSALVPKATDWLGFPIDPTSDSLILPAVAGDFDATVGCESPIGGRPGAKSISRSTPCPFGRRVNLDFPDEPRGLGMAPA